jgi:hydroxyacylglutathione hydrolase
MFYTKGVLFCGDTLFSVGCGRLFEGTPRQMTETHKKITRLPTDTMLYCTHEYTQANIEFALDVEPDNEYLKQYKLWVERQIFNNKPTLPTMLQEQLKLNPFLRLNESNVKLYADKFAQNLLSDSVQVFAALRQAKDEF